MRFNAVFFTFGIVAVGVAFTAGAIASFLPYVQGGPVAGAANEYALLVTLASALGGIGFIAMGFGSFVFSQNYEPILQESRLVAFSAIPYGVFLITSHAARLKAGGANDFFGYGVSRSAEGTATLYVAIPESYATLGPYLVIGSVAVFVCFFGLAQFLANMKIVKEVGNLTIRLTKAVGFLACAGQVLMFAGYSSFTAENTGTEWLGPGFIAYFVGYLILAFAVPVLGAVVAYRAGTIFWDAAKTVRYLSDFSKRTSADAEKRARDKTDNRPWWERLSEEGKEKE